MIIAINIKQEMNEQTMRLIIYIYISDSDEIMISVWVER